jgi:hypothetical protein
MYVQQNTGAGGSGTHTRKRQGYQHLKCDLAQSNIAVGKEWSTTLVVYRFSKTKNLLSNQVSRKVSLFASALTLVTGSSQSRHKQFTRACEVRKSCEQLCELL